MFHPFFIPMNNLSLNDRGFLYECGLLREELLNLEVLKFLAFLFRFKEYLNNVGWLYIHKPIFSVLALTISPILLSASKLSE